jgi:hypothetical protein
VTLSSIHPQPIAWQLKRRGAVIPFGLAVFWFVLGSMLNTDTHNVFTLFFALLSPVLGVQSVLVGVWRLIPNAGRVNLTQEGVTQRYILGVSSVRWIEVKNFDLHRNFWGTKYVYASFHRIEPIGRVKKFHVSLISADKKVRAAAAQKWNHGFAVRPSAYGQSAEQMLITLNQWLVRYGSNVASEPLSEQLPAARVVQR